MTNEISTTTNRPPAPIVTGDLASQLRKHENRINEVANAVSYIINSREQTVEGLTKALAEFDAFAEKELPVMRSDLEKADNPASSHEIAASVAMLVGCFPNIHNNDRTIFMQQLITLLEGWQVGGGCLGLAMRHLTLTCEYLPSIAKVREALAQAQESLRKMSNRLDGDPQIIGDEGIYDYRQILRRRIEDLNGVAAARYEVELEGYRLERERKKREKQEQARREAKENYHVQQQWALDMIGKVLVSPGYSTEEKNERTGKVLDVITTARKKLDDVASK